MAFELTPKSLKNLCRDLNLYASVPELNDILYLQHKGITKLQNLDAYKGLKTLYLECNAISVISGLESLTNLRCLYLGQNIIHKIEGLASLTNLESLDLAENDIYRVENLSCLPKLATLNLAGNKLQTRDDLEHLEQCISLTSLDISKNRIDDPAALDLLVGFGRLSLLRLVGNELVSKTRSYRKRMLASMPKLNYLDDSPCFDKDRRLAIAFMKDGMAAEREMRDVIRKEEDARRQLCMRDFNDMVERAKQRAKLHPPPPHDPMRFRAVPPGESDDENETCFKETTQQIESETHATDEDSTSVASAAEEEHAPGGGQEVAASPEESSCDRPDCSMNLNEGCASSLASSCPCEESEDQTNSNAESENSDNDLRPPGEESCEESGTEMASTPQPSAPDSPDVGPEEVGTAKEDDQREEDIPHTQETNELVGKHRSLHAELKHELLNFRKKQCGRRTEERMDARDLKFSSPRVWGTPNYRKLWTLAVGLGERKRIEAAPLEQSNLLNLEIRGVGTLTNQTPTRVSENPNVDGEDSIPVATCDRAGNIESQSSDPPVENQAGVSGSDPSSEVPPFQLEEGGPASAEGIEVEFHSEEDSEWEMVIDDVDPLERYTITTVAKSGE